jgi:hypothetical protein
MIVELYGDVCAVYEEHRIGFLASPTTNITKNRRWRNHSFESRDNTSNIPSGSNTVMCGKKKYQLLMCFEKQILGERGNEHRQWERCAGLCCGC